MQNHLTMHRCETAAEFQRPERGKQDAVLRKVLKKDVSIRQAFRLTGISIGVISGFVNG